MYRLLAVSLLILLFALSCAHATRVSARDQIFSCFFAGTTTSGNLFVATSPDDIAGSHRVQLYGISIPARAESAFQKYVQKMLGGFLLHVRIKKRLSDRSIPAMVGEVMIVQGKQYVNFNKALLRDGYALLDRGAPANYARFSRYAQSKRVGIYSKGRPRWVVPKGPPEETVIAGAATDRDKTIQKYGLPTYSNRTLIPDNYSILQYHLYITDFYLNLGQVFIYRDGKLVNRQEYGR